MLKNYYSFITIFLIIILTSGTRAQDCQHLNVDRHHDVKQIGDVDEIRDLQDSLVTNFPNICKKVIIGTSVSGYDIVALKFSDNVNIDEPEPEVLLTFCIHGDENNPEQVAMKLARRLCLDYNSDPQTKNLIDNREIWIIAVMNPDGLRGINYFNRPNANGIDMNRNYGYMWNKEDFDPNEYSEPETKATRDFILSRNFNVMIDYHSGLQGIIYPWYYKGADSPDKIEIEYLANQYDVVSGYPTNEFAVTAGFDLYATNGALVEFAYGSLGILAFSVELMSFNNPAFNNCQLYTMNKPSIFMMLDNAGKGVSGKVTDAITGNPIQAKISIGNKIPSYSSATNGDYHRFLRSGTYSITVSANGYASETRTVTVTNGTLVTENFQLNTATNYSAQKIITCRNFNNYSDPAETWNALGVNDGNYYAIGDTGYVVLDMGGLIEDKTGNDITVFGSASEKGNGFEVFNSSSIDGPWTSMGTGTATSSFDVNGVNNARYIKLVDNGIGAGKVLGAGFHLDAIIATNIATSVDELAEQPVNFELSQNYPNPFNPTTTINFNIGQATNVKLEVFNTLGQKIATLVNSSKIAGRYSVKFTGDKLVSGLYIYRLTTAQFTETKKMILLK